MPNVITTETENIKLAWTHQEKRRQPVMTNDGHGRIGEEKRGRPRRRWIDNTREDMEKYESWHDWKMMAHKDVEMVSKGVITNISCQITYKRSRAI